MRLVNHPVGPFAHADADRGGDGLSGSGSDLDGINRRHQGTGHDLGRVVRTRVDGPTLNGALARTAGLQLVFCVLLTAGILIS